MYGLHCPETQATVSFHSKNEGEITMMGNVQGEPSVTVDFGVTGIKKLLLKFAKFEIIG